MTSKVSFTREHHLPVTVVTMAAFAQTEGEELAHRRWWDAEFTNPFWSRVEEGDLREQNPSSWEGQSAPTI